MQKHVEACSVVWAREGACEQVDMWLKSKYPFALRARSHAASCREVSNM